MSAAPRLQVLSDPLGGSALSRAIQERRLPPALQPWWPATLAEWREHAGRVRGSASSGWLDALGSAFHATGPAAVRLQRAAQGGIVITTGQQAGLFGGPLYTLSKAISALALADSLEEQLGIPVAPVFWAATDDADFAEASVVHVAGTEGLTRLEWTNRPAAGTPMARAPLGDVTALLRQLQDAGGSAANDRFLGIARESFSADRTFGDAYVELLRGILQPLSIAVLDSSHPDVAAPAAPILRGALSRAGDVQAAVAKRTGELRQAGFEPQVEDDRGLSLVFEQRGGTKRRVSVADAAGADAAPGAAYSPNVLLRPIVERAILPTAGYVAGPGELAYFTQVSVVARALEAETPVGVPRWSCTVVEPFTQRALERLGVGPRDLQDLHGLERRFAERAMPAEVSEAWTRLEQRLAESLDGLGKAARSTGLVPDPVIEGLGRSLAHKLGRTERRLRAAAKRRDEQVRRDLAVASAALFPGGQRQERTLSFIPMLARSGDDLLSAMTSAARQHARSLLGPGEPAAVR